MTLFLFLVWLQMSAQPVTLSDGVNFSAASQCQEGLAIYITGKDGKSDEIAKCVNGYYERVPRAKTLIDDRPTQRGIIQPSLLDQAQRAADETDGKLPPCKMDDGTPCEYKAVVIPPGASMLPVTWPEPVDVPAVRHVDRRMFYCGERGVPRCDHGEFLKGEFNGGPMCPYDDAAKKLEASCTQIITYRCKDKARILEHDENSPPKYWCRRVQP